MPAKRHTVASVAAELAALLPDLDVPSSKALTRTLLRNLCGYSPRVGSLLDDLSLPAEERTKVMRFAKRRYL